jgi:hypothetical protein
MCEIPLQQCSARALNARLCVASNNRIARNNSGIARSVDTRGPLDFRWYRVSIAKPPRPASSAESLTHTCHLVASDADGSSEFHALSPRNARLKSKLAVAQPETACNVRSRKCRCIGWVDPPRERSFCVCLRQMSHANSMILGKESDSLQRSFFISSSWNPSNLRVECKCTMAKVRTIKFVRADV